LDLGQSLCQVPWEAPHKSSSTDCRTLWPCTGAVVYSRTSVEALAGHHLPGQDAQGKEVHAALGSYRRLACQVSSGDLHRGM